MSRLNFSDKFRFSQKEQYDLLVKNFTRLIKIHANFEGIACTMPQTQEVIDYGRSKSLRIDEVNTILGLKRAWQGILDAIISENRPNEIGFRFVSFMHYTLMRGLLSDEALGRVRVDDVNISGTNWKHKLPNVYEFDSESLNLAYWGLGKTEYALELFCLIARTQAFIDGNKRTAFMVANTVLSLNGLGYLETPSSSSFRNKLLRIYETGDTTDLKRYLYKYYVKGV